MTKPKARAIPKVPMYSPASTAAPTAKNTRSSVPRNSDTTVRVSVVSMGSPRVDLELSWHCAARRAAPPVGRGRRASRRARREERPAGPAAGGSALVEEVSGGVGAGRQEGQVEAADESGAEGLVGGECLGQALGGLGGDGAGGQAQG